MKIHQVIDTKNKNTVKYRALSCFCMRGNCDCFSTKTHVLIKEINEKQPRVPRDRFRKNMIKIDSSSEDTDTEIEYAESDQSDWNEAGYFDDNDPEEQETCREKTEKIMLSEKIIQNKTEPEIENHI
ncbi:unnamed protein product [Parnassius apollo]|uniref:(apollo) hypothetical protein n=1 Tax=Parnassius apollo TaxID=110799 RepID=A0A8S3YGW1_PARAO|nr:unnamed protein product [Parnassius apollo]